MSVLPSALPPIIISQKLYHKTQLTASYDTICVPSFSNLLHTFRGSIENTCLSDRPKLMKDFFETMYLNGYIPESKFDEYEIPKDTNSKNEVIEKVDDISMENRHRAKILSSPSQIKARRQLVDQKRMKEYKTKLRHYESEQDEKKLNECCEKKFVKYIMKSIPALLIQHQAQSENGDSCIAFDKIRHKLTMEILKQNAGDVLKNELRAFVRVRSKRCIRRGKVSFLDVPSKKESLLDKCVSLKDHPFTYRIQPNAPVLPQLLEPDHN